VSLVQSAGTPYQITRAFSIVLNNS